MRYALLTVSLIGMVGGNSLGAPKQAAKPETNVRFDDSSRGDLAFATKAGGPWKVVRRGEVLPPEAILRTSAAGMCRIQLGGGSLQLAPETQARLLTKPRQIVVISGRVFAQSLPEWSIRVGNLNGTLTAETAAEFEIDGEQRVSARVAAGAMQVAGNGVEPENVTVGQGAVREPKTARLTIAALSPAEIERLRDTTEPPRKTQGLGQLVVNDPQSNSPVRLNLARYHVNVVLHPPVALVQIDQSFYNPYPRQQEGTFVFNLPDGASVSRFAMYTTPTQLVEGELIEREKAANIYQSIVNRQRDPAILEQIGGNLFRMRVFPIFARDTKRILLDYTVPIVEQDDGRYSFELPLMSDLEPVWDFAITGAIRGPNVAGTARSPSHPAVAFDAAEDGAIKFAFRQNSYRPDSAFILGFQQRPAAEAVVRSFGPIVKREPNAESKVRANEDEPEDQVNHSPCQFLATISPEVLDKAAGAPRGAPSPADVLILADTSGGITDRARLRQAVRMIAGSLRAADRFRLGCVDVGCRPLTKDWVAPQTADAREALAQFDREFFLGETDFDEGLNGAVKLLPEIEKGRRRFVIYVGDGNLPAEQPFRAESHRRRIAALARAGARFCAVLVENDPSGSGVLEQLAAATGGRLFRTGRTESSGELYGWLLKGCPGSPKLVAVNAAGVPDDELFVPTAWVPGQSLQIYGRRSEAGPMKLNLKFEHEGKTASREWTLVLKNDPDDVFVGRLWGQRKLNRLRLLVAGQNDDQERQNFVQQIVALSQEWTLLSPHTAFLVLENDEEYPKYGIKRQLRHQYWKPADAVAAEPLPQVALEALKNPARPPRTITTRQYDAALTAARKALDGHAPDRALVALENVVGSPLAVGSDEFKSLQASARKLLVQGDLLRNLGPQRGWFDRQTPIGFETPLSEAVWQMLYGYGSAGNYDEPRLAVLGKRVAPPAHEITIEEFAEWFQEASGLEVFLDKATLTDEGVALDQPASVRGIRSMSLESLLRHVLNPVQLTWVFEDDVLKITTSAKAGEKLTARLYPVTDLIQTTRATDYSLLVNPDLDRELLSNRRLNEKLDRKIAVNFADKPLEEIFDFLGDKLDDNLIIDRPTLTDEGVALDQPVTINARNLPLRSVLAQLCEPVQLTYTIEDEAVMITTSAKAGEKLQTRLHSGRGIIYELPPDLVQLRAQLPPRVGTKGFIEMGGFGAGMMGGMGMGMGGMGGFGGGGAPPAAPGNATVSETTADGDALPTTDDAPEPSLDLAPERDDDRPAPPAAGVLGPGAKIGFPARRRSTTTAYETIELITRTIQPDSWEDLSGPGSIMYFPGSLGFAVRQTQAVHEEVAELLGRLRDMPPAFAERSGYIPAKIPRVGPADFDTWDINGLMNVLTTVIQPDTWEDLSGPGSIQMYTPKLVMSVLQAQEVHREIRNLLTSLRRARYLARQGRTWKSFDLSEGPWFAGVLGLTDLPAGPLLSELPEPAADALAALESLGTPIPGEQTWRSIRAGGGQPQTTVIRNGAVRSEFEFEGRLARVEGDEAAVAYPGISIVERGEWGEALRRIVDGRLPWLPHRSHRDLAHLFRVKIAGEDKQSVQLQLEIPGARTGTDILITVSRANKLPTLWECRLDDQPALRLRFEDLGEADGKPIWKKVIAENAAGHEVERWELVGFNEPTSDLPPLDAGWNDWFVIDLREQERAPASPIIQVLRGVRVRDWNAADRALAAALQRQPGQPFLLLIKAWNLAQREGNHEVEIVALLKEVARSGRGDLLRPLTDHSFGALDDEAIYDILNSQPPDRRRVADRDHLAEIAIRLGNPREAVAHLRAAIEQAGPSGDDPEREKRLVELLLETKHIDEALTTAEARAARPDVKPEDMAGLAEALHQWGSLSESAKFMREALAHKDVTGERRQKLLHRRARLETGPVRWKTLLEAMDVLPADSPSRAASTKAILADLTDVAQGDQVGKMGDEVQDKTVQSALRLRQADLYLLRANVGPAADIGWKLYEAKQLPAERIEWLCGRLAAAGQHERLIQLAESRLRSGKSLEQNVLNALSAAYDAQGRPDAAKRARTNARDLKPPPKPLAPQAVFRGGFGFFSVP